MQTITTLAQEAYNKDFRWWFLALLIAVLGGGLWALRYLLSKAEKEQATHAAHVAMLVNELSTSRENHQKRMETLTLQAFSQNEKMAVVVAQNTAESAEVRRYLERIQQREEIERLQKAAAKSA